MAAAAVLLCVWEKLMEARDVFAHNGEIFCEMWMIFHFHDDAIILDGHRVAEPSNMNYKFCVREKHTRVVCRERRGKIAVEIVIRVSMFNIIFFHSSRAVYCFHLISSMTIHTP